MPVSTDASSPRDPSPRTLRATLFRRYSLRASDFANRGCHLVNDGVQNKEKSYGKFEQGNKLSMADFEAKLVATRDDVKEGWVEAVFRPRAEQLMSYCVDAAHATINADKKTACFELLGFDFMLDEDLRVDLIEVNSNPCLETWSCPLLEESLPKLIDDVMRVGLDQILPPPAPGRATKRQAEALEALEAAGHGFSKIYTPPGRDVVAVAEGPAPAAVAEAPAPAESAVVVAEGVGAVG